MADGRDPGPAAGRDQRVELALSAVALAERGPAAGAERVGLEVDDHRPPSPVQASRSIWPRMTVSPSGSTNGTSGRSARAVELGAQRRAEPARRSAAARAAPRGRRGPPRATRALELSSGGRLPPAVARAPLERRVDARCRTRASGAAAADPRCLGQLVGRAPRRRLAGVLAVVSGRRQGAGRERRARARRRSGSRSARIGERGVGEMADRHRRGPVGRGGGPQAGAAASAARGRVGGPLGALGPGSAIARARLARRPLTRDRQPRVTVTLAVAAVPAARGEGGQQPPQRRVRGLRLSAGSRSRLLVGAAEDQAVLGPRGRDVDEPAALLGLGLLLAC